MPYSYPHFIDEETDTYWVVWCAQGYWVSTRQSWVWIWVIWLHLYHSHHACGEYELINYSTLILMNLPVLQKQESWELTRCQDSLAAWVLQVIQVWPCRWIPMTFGRETEVKAHSWCFCIFRTSMFLKRSLFLWSLQQWSLYSMRLACCCTSTVPDAGLGRNVWFQKQQEWHLPDRGQGGKPGLLASGLWKTAELLVVRFGSVAFHSWKLFLWLFLQCYHSSNIL